MIFNDGLKDDICKPVVLDYWFTSKIKNCSSNNYKRIAIRSKPQLNSNKISKAKPK